MNIFSSLLCEVRVPTYRRPAMLRRALDSLRGQTHANWVALVFDDSDDRDGAAVVEEIGDARILYRPNAQRRRCAGNIDQVFQTRAYLGGEYACILEDDNLLLPDFLRDNLECARSHAVPIVLRNQAIYRDAPSVGAQPTGRTTRGGFFDERTYYPRELHAALWLAEGISNGGLFWSTRARTNFQVGPLVEDSGLQEHCRTWQVEEPLFFASEPLAVWSDLDDAQSHREPSAHRVFRRGQQSIRRHLLRRYGRGIIGEGQAFAARIGAQDVLRRSLFDTLSPQFPVGWWDGMQIAKSLARLAFVRDPLKNYFSANREAPPA